MAKKDNVLLQVSGTLALIEDLTSEERGVLFTAILLYRSTGEVIDMDRVVMTVFRFMRNVIDTNEEKYLETCKLRAECGKAGGLAKAQNAKQELANLANASKTKQIKQDDPDTVSDTDTDSDSVTVYVSDKKNDISAPLDSGMGVGAKKSKPSEDPKLEQYFDYMWKGYPKKDGKQDAFKRYRKWFVDGVKVKGKKTKLTNDQIYSGIQRYVEGRESEKTELKYYKLLSTLLNDDFYLNWVFDAEQEEMRYSDGN